MDSPLLHPYTLFRKGLPSSASALSLRAPRRFAFDGWESPRPSTGSDGDSTKAFMKAPLDPPDVPTLQGSPYVKHGSGITVLLLGHKAGTSFPVYQSGSMLNGMVVLEKPTSIASVDVKVRDLQLTSCPVKSHFFMTVGSIRFCSRNPRRGQERHRVLLGPADLLECRQRQFP